jgi:nitric oxide reductase NorQ protein
VIETCAASRYLAAGRETELFRRAYERKVPVMLLGPTGCGKTRFVEHMAGELRRPLVTITCHDDLTTADLVGRHLIRGGDVEWRDGPLTAAVRRGAICYLDEIVEARPDTLAMLHSLADHRRALYLERLGEELVAPHDFMLVASYNPRPGTSVKELKPALRQRFATIRLDYLPADQEAGVVAAESGAPVPIARRLVECAAVLRAAAERDPYTRFDPPSTRSIVAAAAVIAGGTPLDDAVEAFLVAPLTTDPAVTHAIRAVVAAALPGNGERPADGPNR